jgi:DNA segregation ATPase FtsK/SpoIIIE-like protein
VYRHAREGHTTVNLQRSPEPTLRNRTVAEWLWPFVPMGIAALSLSALWYYHLHRHEFVPQSVLQKFYAGLYRQVGFTPSVMFFGMAILWSTLWCVQGRIERPVGRLLRLCAMAVMLGTFLNLGDGGVAAADHKGAIGAACAGILVAAFGYVPSLLVVWAMTFATLLLATDFFFYDSFERLRRAAPAPPPADAGVEPAVTEQFRALAAAAPPPAVQAPEAGATPDADAEPPPAVAPASPRRASYYERRHERAAARARAEEEWVPAAPDSQEIDNPESQEPLAEEASAAATRMPQRSEVPASTAAAAAPQPLVEDSLDAALVGAADEPPPVEPIEAEFEASIESPAREAIVEIPRPEPESRPLPTPVSESAPEPLVAAAAGAAAEPAYAEPVPAEPRAAAALPSEPVQQHLFGVRIDDALVQEAIEVVKLWRRASAAFLQRKLRIDYETATAVLGELAVRGVVRLDGDGAHGRLVD